MLEQGAFDPARGWALVKSSVEVLRRHKILLVYPVAALVYTVSFSLLLLGVDVWTKVNSGWLWFAASYLSMMFGFTFTNVALNYELMKAFSGEPVSLRRGMAFALGRIKAIFLWSLLAGVVGLVIQEIDDRLGFFGKVFMRLPETVWSVASVFVIPVMIREESSNPFELLRQSAGIIKRNWKSVPVTFVGLGLYGFLSVLAFCAVIVSMALYIAVASSMPALDFGDIGLLVCILAVMGVMFLPVIIFGAIFRCACYVYATEGVVPAPFNAELMDGAWKVK